MNQSKTRIIFVCLLFINQIFANVNPQPGENIWRMAARIGMCLDTESAKLNWLESQQELICSKIEEIDIDLASHNDVVYSKLERIESIVDEVTGIDAVCSKLEDLDENFFAHDASICSKIEQIDSKQDLLISAVDRLITEPCEILIFQTDIPFTITQPGVYCLAESVSFDAGTAITIASDNVVLDLNEKKVDGAAGGNIGVAINSGLQNITIQNGVLCNMNNKGIDADATNNIAFVSMTVNDSLIDSVVDMPALIAPITCLQIKDVKVLNVGMFKQFPIVSVVDSIVDSIIDVPDCVLSPITGININCADKVVVNNCKVLYGLGDGFALQQVENGVFTSCQAIKNGGNGFVLDNVDTTCLKWCKANMNCLHGVCDSACNGDNVYLGCLAKQNGIHGFNIAGGGKVVQECVASQNTRDGFNLSTSLLKDGDLDVTFGGDGKVTTNFDGGGASGVAVQKDGKIVVAGTSNLAFDFALARYNIDGSLDNTFGVGGTVITNFGPGSFDFGSAVAIQEDGKIVMVGFVTGVAGFDFGLARYNTDGSLDITFGDGGKVTTNFGSSDIAFSIAIQKNGKIVVVGQSGGTGDSDFAIARYNIDGSLDLSFGIGGLVTTNFTADNRARAVALQKDGKIVVAGQAGDENGNNNEFAVARYNIDGSLDFSFGVGGKVTTSFDVEDRGFAIAIQKDGKIIVAGDSNPGFFDFDFAVARYNTDGSLDSSFGTGGKVITDFGGTDDRAFALTLQKDGKIIVAGQSNVQDPLRDFALVRYNANGSLDNTFGTNGKTLTDFGGTDNANAITIQTDGKIVAVGIANSNFGIARYVVFKRGVAVRDCVAEENGEDGFNIAGVAYDVRDSAAIHNVADGFLLASLTDSCQLLSNEALQNNNIGFENLGGSGNQIFNNRAHDNIAGNYANVPLVTMPILTTSFWANAEV